MATCPICKGARAGFPDNASFPFCSRRCKLADLGNWLDGNYAVPAEPADPQSLESAPDSSDEGPELLH